MRDIETIQVTEAALDIIGKVNRGEGSKETPINPYLAFNTISAETRERKARAKRWNLYDRYYKRRWNLYDHYYKGRK
jgi:hypothetical protein